MSNLSEPKLNNVYSLMGRNALPDHVQAHLAATLGEFTAHHLYFINANALNDERLLQLSALLDVDAKLLNAVDGIICIPRIGTISPWSSKATDIVHQAGFTDIQRIEHGIVYRFSAPLDPTAAYELIHDPMTEQIIENVSDAAALFETQAPKGRVEIDILLQGAHALDEANQTYGLGLMLEEKNYLLDYFLTQKRNPSLSELMMFAQANSEHCRHKIFNAKWHIDDKPMPDSLFAMIKHTYALHSQGILSAYEDNAAVLQGNRARQLSVHPQQKRYQFKSADAGIVFKVETHNHPTAISPYAGAATGSGGEIRDIAATGRGAKPKAGLVGLSISNLFIPGFTQPWECSAGQPKNRASALKILLDAPIGSANYNNEFGRPVLTGYLRTYEQQVPGLTAPFWCGYHKPILIAGGMGTILPNHVEKQAAPDHAWVVVLGGPAYLIGLGGGAASSATAGDSKAQLDFASVQRPNPEMQRRAQEVIEAVRALGTDNPILSIHDVGAGGLANAVPELLADAHRGGTIQLRAIPSAEPGMSPMAIWCNEAQERYVFAIKPADFPIVADIAIRERCPCVVIGEVSKKEHLTIQDSLLNQLPVDVSMDLMFGNTPRVAINAKRNTKPQQEFLHATVDLSDAITRVLRLPACGSKKMLITIADRSVGGLTARDQLVGPWQVPVADCAVTSSEFGGALGEAMSMGERTPVAVHNPVAAARLAVGEAITNIAAAPIRAISDIILSANWMAAFHDPDFDVELYDAVRAVAMEFCPRLGICIPVGKDSLSMRTTWKEKGETHTVKAPLSLIVSACAKVSAVRQTLTPQLRVDMGASKLLLIDLGKQRLGGSALTQVYHALDSRVADCEDPDQLLAFFNLIQRLNADNYLHAYHDRSDGGLLLTICEMAFAGHCGVTLDLASLGSDLIAALFNEELGAVVQIKQEDYADVMDIIASHGLDAQTFDIGTINCDDVLEITANGQSYYRQSRTSLWRTWSETSYHIQRLRDNPECAQAEFDGLLDETDPGISAVLTFDPSFDICAPFLAVAKPQVAILREQGINGQHEMAAAFMQAGFATVDVHMSDLVSGEVTLDAFQGLAACGGFSYGDVLGAGRGWASAILWNERLREIFSRFFHHTNTFTLGICNGCQMLSYLSELIPCSDQWPQFTHNQSHRFESRLVTVEVMPSPSIFLTDMVGSKIPIVVSHGEGRVVLPHQNSSAQHPGVALRYVDNRGQMTEQYPLNPNGSALGMTGFTNRDGRVLMMMPHPERVFLTQQFSYAPKTWGEVSPWLRLFQNARRFCQ